MSDYLLSLGARVAAASIEDAPAATRQTIDYAARASLLCVMAGIERESWVWDFPARAGADASGVTKLLAGLFEPLEGVGQLATLAGAADFDPMDPGPSHTPLPAILAACIASSLNRNGEAGSAADAQIASGVLAGCDAAMRVRRAVSGTRPGVGFHSPGTFGTIAAAAGAARALGLGPEACTNALAIALTRASGLAINSAATIIGLTHFGWGTLHGLEAALLASEGWSASHDVQRALATLFGGADIDLDSLVAEGPEPTEYLVFKHYPCNIYLNLVVKTLEEVNKSPIDRIEIDMPWVPHLDCPQPRDVRQARNSAQAVAAIAGAGDTSYAAFSGPRGRWHPSPDVARLLANIRVTMDRSAPTRLTDAAVTVRVWRGTSLVHDETRTMADLRGWGVAHARGLMGGDDKHGGVDALYGSTYLHAFRHLQQRRLTTLAKGTS